MFTLVSNAAILSIALLFNLSAFGQSKQCTTFNDEVLVAPVSESKFIKDEKSALGFIEKFDVNKLGLETDQSMRNKWVSECKGPQKLPKLPYCNHGVPTFVYFKALLHGVKNNSWSEDTKKLALNKFWSYVDEVRKNQGSLLHLILVINLLENASSEGLASQVDPKAIRSLKIKIEQENETLTKNVKGKDATYTCAEIKSSVEEEREIVKKYTPQLNLIIK